MEHNAKVYLAARSKEKAEKAIAELKEETGKEAYFLELDLASMASVRKAASEFLSQEKTLHILFNNASVGEARVVRNVLTCPQRRHVGAAGSVDGGRIRLAVGNERSR